MRNPMNDDEYDSSDEQIEDLKKLVNKMGVAIQGMLAHLTRSSVSIKRAQEALAIADGKGAANFLNRKKKV